MLFLKRGGGGGGALKHHTKLQKIEPVETREARLTDGTVRLTAQSPTLPYCTDPTPYIVQAWRQVEIKFDFSNTDIIIWYYAEIGGHRTIRYVEVGGGSDFPVSIRLFWDFPENFAPLQPPEKTEGGGGGWVPAARQAGGLMATHTHLPKWKKLTSKTMYEA